MKDWADNNADYVMQRDTATELSVFLACCFKINRIGADGTSGSENGERSDTDMLLMDHNSGFELYQILE